MVVKHITFKIRQIKDIDPVTLKYKIYTHVQEVLDTDNPNINYVKSSSAAPAYKNNISEGNTSESKFLKCLKYCFLMQTNLTDNENKNIWVINQTVNKTNDQLTRPDIIFERLIQPSDIKTVSPNIIDTRMGISWSTPTGLVLLDDSDTPPTKYKATPTPGAGGASTYPYPAIEHPTADELIACFDTYKINPSINKTMSGNFVSDTLLMEFDSLKNAEDFSSDILDKIRNFKIIYEKLLNNEWSTMYDTSTSPNGFNTYIYQ